MWSTLKSSSIISDTGLIPTLREPLLNREEAKGSSQNRNFYQEKFMTLSSKDKHCTS